MFNKSNQFWLFTIFAIGALLRFYYFWDWSLTNDELSALNRLQFETFGQLFNEGIKIDGHPAFTQLFLYIWIKLAQNNVFLIRLPFVLAGIASLYYFHKLSLNWLNKNAALLSLSLFSISYPFVLYSQIARPYSFGILFTIAFTYYWLRIIRNESKIKQLVGFIVFGFLGVMTHYFSSFQIALLLLIGFFSLPKNQIKTYLFGAISITILFLPHLNITLYQLSIGGIYWLPEPEAGFMFRFITYFFNSSWILKNGIVLFPILLIPFYKSTCWKPKSHFLLLSLFLIPYFTLYFYSIHITPILQFSALLFAAPFFILFLNSFISKEINSHIINLLLFFILGIGTYSLVISSKIFNQKNFANFKSVAKKTIEINQKYGAENLIAFSNSTDSSYLEFYYNKLGSKPRFNKLSFSQPIDIVEARNIITSSNASFLMMAYAGTEIPLSVHEYAKEKYSSIENHERFFNSEVILYKKSDLDRETVFQTHYEDYYQNSKWKVSELNIKNSVFRSSPISFYLDSTTEYALTYSDTVKNLYTLDHNFLTVKAWIKSDSIVDAKLVLSINRDDEVIDWKGINIDDYWEKDEWYQLILVYENRYFMDDSDQISIYFWNPGKENLVIDDFEIINFADSDYNYYKN